MKIKAVFLGLTLSYSLAALSQNSGNCSPWVKTVEEYYQNGQRISLKTEYTKFRKAALTIDSLVKKNPNFRSIAPARFRSSLVIAAGAPASIQLNIKAYNKDGWDTKCGLIPQADRIASDKVGISVTINLTGSHYTSHEISATQDEKLDAFKQPVVSRTISGFPLYYQSLRNHFLLITYDGKEPWEPVTQAEYLDFIERKLLRKINEHARNSTSVAPNTKDPKKSSYYLELKKTDPKAAEEFLKLAEQTTSQYQASLKEANRLRQQAAEDLQQELAEFRALRANMSATELKQQAIRGHSKFGLYTDEYPTIKDPLVKIKKEYLVDLKNKTQIKVISIWAGGTDPEWNEHIQKTIETLDYQVIKSLMLKTK